MPKNRGHWVDENGQCVGETHHRAKLTDVEVDLIRTFHEEGMVGYRTLAKQFGVPRTTIAEICQYRRRYGIKAVYKTVRVPLAE